MSNFRENLNALREISEPKKTKLILEKITGKKLVDYEGIDALVGALMRYYNEELKKNVSKTGDTMIGNLKISKLEHPELVLEYTNYYKNPRIKFKDYSLDSLVIEGTVSEKDTLTIYSEGLEKVKFPKLQVKKIEQGVEKFSEILNETQIYQRFAGSEAWYIQDSGTKEAGKEYIDKTTGEPYYCIETNNDTVPIKEKYILSTLKGIMDRDVNEINVVYDAFTSDTYPNGFSAVGNYTINLKKGYKFICVYIGNRANPNEGLRSLLIPYKYKNNNYVDYGMDTPASERVTFKFTSDINLQIEFHKIDGISQTDIVRIIQF